jgi:hypothetical protein
MTSYQKSLVKLVGCVKSYELREGSTVIEVKMAKNGRTWKFGFCRDMSLALGVLGLLHDVSVSNVTVSTCSIIMYKMGSFVWLYNYYMKMKVVDCAFCYLLASWDERVSRRALELDAGGAGELGQPERLRERDDVLVEEAGTAAGVLGRFLKEIRFRIVVSFCRHLFKGKRL